MGHRECLDARPLRYRVTMNVASAEIFRDGMQLRVTDVGAAIAALRLPVRGSLVDVVLGYPELDTYAEADDFMGACIGRFANRIEKGQFRLNGEHYQLDINEVALGNCLHGGAGGFHRRRWFLEHGDDGTKLLARCRSLDGDQGFPGNLDATVRYSIATGNTLLIEWTACSDRDTIINLTQHAYFNLDGRNVPASTIADHLLTLHAEHYTVVDHRGIPTGEIRSVSDGPFDWRCEQRVGDQLDHLARSNAPSSGFDHNFVIAGSPGDMRPAASLYSPRTGIRMNVKTTQPGVQLYTGDHLGSPFKSRQGLCLETQNFPNAPSVDAFPSAVLRAGEIYREGTELEFVVV